MKRTFAVIGNTLALFVYGIGLLAPLTPSEGIPSFWELLLFVGIPLIVLFFTWRAYESKPAKIGVAFQAIAIGGFTMWLLLLESGVQTNGS